MHSLNRERNRRQDRLMQLTQRIASLRQSEQNIQEEIRDAQREVRELVMDIQEEPDTGIYTKTQSPAGATSFAFMDYWNGVREANGLQAVWNLPRESGMNCNGTHPYAGATTLLYGSYWGPVAVRVPVQGHTWLDLYRAADQAIRESGDDHHIYIERFDREGNTLVLSTGS